MSKKQPELIFENDLFKKAQHSYRVINHSLRQKIIALIHKNGTLPVTDIYRRLKIEQSVASSHLGLLRKERYLITQKRARFVFYSVNYKRIREVEKISRELGDTEDEA